MGFASPPEHSSSVIVETFLHGDDHRLLVVNGELVAATKRTPGHVVGDGKHTVPSWSTWSTRTRAAASATKR